MHYCKLIFASKGARTFEVFTVGSRSLRGLVYGRPYILRQERARVDST